jgi:hypothetical protein
MIRRSRGERATARTIGPRSGQNGRRGRESVIISAGIAILAAVVLICTGLVVVPLWTALVQGWRFQPIADQCKMLKDAHARAACEREADGRCILPDATSNTQPSLYRAYDIAPRSLSNSYAPMGTLTIEIFKPEIFKPEIFKPSSAKRAERSERIPQDQ